MAAKPPKPADRAAVLAWMAKEGKGATAAAAHFGLALGTVKDWRRAQIAAHPPSIRHPSASVSARPVAKDSHGHPIKPPPPPIESFTPRARDSLRVSFDAAQGYGRIAARHVAEYEAVQIERDRQRKLGVPEGALPELPKLMDPKALVAAHRAQKLALEIAPGLATFDDATTAPEAKAPPITGKDLAAAIAERMRRPEPAAIPETPSLRVVK